MQAPATRRNLALRERLSMIRPAVAADAEAIARIYGHYVAASLITFEEQPVSSEDMAARMAEVAAGGFPWLVAEADGIIAGYAYAATWKGRCAYRFCVESTIYLLAGRMRQGIGTRLYQELLQRLRTLHLHVVVGCIALPNPESVALHEKCGFRKVGHFPEVGYKFDQWIDVGYWQLLL
jgi:L-amino acid N-acyltransferase YncA